MKYIYKKESLIDTLYQYHHLIPELFRPIIAGTFVYLQKKEVSKNRSPYKLIYFVTNKCNLRCPHCFYRTQLNAPIKDLAIEEITLIAKSIKNKLFHLILTGGEPYLRKDLVSICAVFNKIANAKLISINTNGFTPDYITCQTEKLIQKTDCTYNFQISLDGLEREHNAIREHPEAFSKTLKTINLLKKLRNKYPYRINWIQVVTSFSKSNYQSVDEIVKLVKEMGGVIHGIVMVRGSQKNTYNIDNEKLLSKYDPSNDVMLSLEEIEWTFQRLDDLLWKHNSHNIFYRINREVNRSIIEIMKNKKRLFLCLAGIVDIVLYPDGDVSRCEMLKPIGNIRDTGYDLEKFLKSKKSIQFFENTRNCVCTHDCSLLSSLKLDKHTITSILQ